MHSELLINGVDISIGSVQTKLVLVKMVIIPVEKLLNQSGPCRTLLPKRIHASLFGYGSRGYDIDGASCYIPRNHSL